MVRTHQAAWLAALLAIGAALLLGSALSGPGAAGWVAADAAGPAVRAAGGAVRPLAGLVRHAGRTRGLSEENAELRRRAGRLEAELAVLRERQGFEERAAELRAAVGPGEADRYLSASVLFRDPAPAREALTIDRGERHGVRAGQPVLGPGAALVGVIAEAGPASARVRLLDDAASAIAAVVQTSRTQAALSGGPDGLRLEFVPSGARVAVGDAVLSSALGGGLPGGLPVGRVSAYEADPRALFAVAAVEPFADYARLEQVLVLTGEEPRAAERTGGPEPAP